MTTDAWQDDRNDRRAAPRRTTRTDARLEHPTGVFVGVVRDISFGGALFVTENVGTALALGCRVVLTVTQPEGVDAADLSWRGAIVRSERSGDDGPDRMGYAIAFDEFEPRPIDDLASAD